MPSYKRERDLAVSILRQSARENHICNGCVGAEFALCKYEDGPDETVRCDDCQECICGKCREQSLWTWQGPPAPDMAPVVHCRDCAHQLSKDCTLARIERASMVFLNHDPDWYCGDGERMEAGDE